MTDVLGCELETALKMLREQGSSVTLCEVRSRKGLPDGEKRVVRQQLTQEGCVKLTYAVFQTELNELD